MRMNLSSAIELNKIPEQYYRPANDFDKAQLCRFEKIPTEIYKTQDKAASILAKEISEEIKASQKENRKYVLGLSGGESPVLVYKKLIELHKNEGLSFKNVIAIVGYEYYPLIDTNLGCLAKVKSEFLNHIDIEASNIYSINVNVETDAINKECQDFESKIDKLGGMDHLIVGISSTASIGFNAPGSSASSHTRVVLLDLIARKEAAKSMFNHIDSVPMAAVSIGLACIMKSKKITLVAWGESKSKQIRDAVESQMNSAVPASILQQHSNARVFVDLDAAHLLTRINTPWLVTSCEWDSKLIRRAIVWLCERINKPILKLTNKDYTDNGLGELIVKFGSAYSVNIKVFNDIQHTITGWPGGKPNADDTNRPERANPFPKKVIVFSPHPDDDVISMGGTFRRLVEQGHDVYVAYQTSGNIAVGDEEVIRYVSYLENVAEEYGNGGSDSEIMKKAKEIKHFLMHEKKEGDIERLDVRFMKGRIRREEARTACRYVGVKEENVTFLDLPFYETGAVKKSPIGEADVKIVKEYIESIKPDQIFVAGDLADPHGTHKVCLDAIFAAIDIFKDEKWYSEGCRVWMYRGAWAEWEIEHIEMAVPISPEELRFKRNSILKHQSQMESAPFLGDDERLFWQRAEERNRSTAELYSRLGLASYEAIEAFVEYKTIRD